jgi:hypothetical protein
MAKFSTRGLSGVALMVVGTVLFGAALLPALAGLDLILMLAAIVLTAGTYLVGTDVSGRIV